MIKSKVTCYKKEYASHGARWLVWRKYGTRYLDAKTSRWMSADPALGEYIPGAPVNDQVRKQNQNLPGMDGVFNTVNLHLYHYAGNNPVKYTDPDGRMFGIDDAIGAAIQCFKDGDWNKFGERFTSNFTNSWALFGNMFNTFHNVNNFGDFLLGVGELILRLANPLTYIAFLWGYGVIEVQGESILRMGICLLLPPMILMVMVTHIHQDMCVLVQIGY